MCFVIPAINLELLFWTQAAEMHIKNGQKTRDSCHYWNNVQGDVKILKRFPIFLLHFPGRGSCCIHSMLGITDKEQGTMCPRLYTNCSLTKTFEVELHNLSASKLLNHAPASPFIATGLHQPHLQCCPFHLSVWMLERHLKKIYISSQGFIGNLHKFWRKI